MGRHKWRRRLILLVILFVVGVILLDPDRRTESHTADAASDSKADETIVGWMIERIAAGEVDLSDENSIGQMLGEAERELEITLTTEEKDRVTGFLRTLGTIEVETGDFIEQAQEKYQKYSTGFVEEANEAINEAVESAVADAANHFFDSMKNAVEDFFRNLLPK